MAKSLEPRREAAKRKFDRLARKQDPTREDLQRQIDVAGELALLNAKTMTVDQAQQWADEFIGECPSKERICWAYEFVGRVKQHQENQRGPKPSRDQQAPSSAYDPIVMKARRILKHQGFDLSRDEKVELLELVNRGCRARPETPPITIQELALILQRLRRELGS